MLFSIATNVKPKWQKIGTLADARPGESLLQVPFDFELYLDRLCLCLGERMIMSWRNGRRIVRCYRRGVMKEIRDLWTGDCWMHRLGQRKDFMRRGKATTFFTRSLTGERRLFPVRGTRLWFEAPLLTQSWQIGQRSPTISGYSARLSLIVERQSPADSARNMVLRVGKIRRRWNMGVL